MPRVQYSLVMDVVVSYADPIPVSIGLQVKKHLYLVVPV